MLVVISAIVVIASSLRMDRRAMKAEDEEALALMGPPPRVHCENLISQTSNETLNLFLSI